MLGCAWFADQWALAQEVLNLVWALATLGTKPVPELVVAISCRAAETASDFKPQVSCILQHVVTLCACAVGWVLLCPLKDFCFLVCLSKEGIIYIIMKDNNIYIGQQYKI